MTVVGADPDASVYGGGDGSSYFVESIGHFVHPETTEDTWPQAYDRGIADRFEQIPDRESLLTARALAREDGLLAGPSSGTAVAAALRVARHAGPDDLVVVVLSDSGRSHLSKVFSDDWLRRWGFLEEPIGTESVGELLVRVGAADREVVSVASTATVGDVVRIARGGPDVLVVLARDLRPLGLAATEIMGSVDGPALASQLAAGRASADAAIGDHVRDPLPTVGVGQSGAAARAALGPDHEAAVVLRDGRAVGMISRADLDRSIGE